MGLHLSKIWASKQAMTGQSLKNYGVTFKLVRVQVEHKVPKRIEMNKNSNPFIDSDEEDEKEIDENDKNNTKHFVEIANDNKAESESDSDSESESEKPVKKTKKRAVKKKRIINYIEFNLNHINK